MHKIRKVCTLRLPRYASYMQGPHIYNLPWTPWILSAGLFIVIKSIKTRTVIYTFKYSSGIEDSRFAIPQTQAFAWSMFSDFSIICLIWIQLNFLQWILLQELGATHSNYTNNKFFKDVRAKVFSQRVINNWNKLPTEVVTSSSLSLFKMRCDAFYHEVQYDTWVLFFFSIV